MPGFNFKRPEELARMLARANSDNARLLEDVATKQASLEAATKANARNRELEWRFALRAYRANEKLRRWIVLSKHEPKYYKVIRAGDVEDDEESRSHKSFVKKWRIIEALRGYWLLQLREQDEDLFEGMSAGAIDRLKHEAAEIEAENREKRKDIGLDAKGASDASLRSKKYRLMTKAKALYDAFWQEVVAEDKVIKAEMLRVGIDASEKSWNEACDAVSKRYGLDGLVPVDPKERGSTDYYAELFKSGKLLKKPTSKEPVKVKKKS